jgi:hypothetical protein
MKILNTRSEISHPSRANNTGADFTGESGITNRNAGSSAAV